ncbi:LacI family DNA-binding transcriptional regulator [Sulfitobacter sp. M57]|uniref:LacI family DNA-binding transcriptional regulator n=1 Tax=unclassified Sulfitobacter TaxID=196795 RepID=UPI0023E0DD96|nr:MULTISPECIES: LacI family DNA-binding transcriptional regulator [unclassified Sulfitobacter]MDF3415702.1 LacI family DNA-binding transcriptional regulator [Sulfitobacter sp. KE5]MDF3423182.1 LacI family DNA-binding transcriptional regulator [Sulfitobacter sp. KE43]MDF3434248.1 LacI family DNA-binding transcriptional regulator [Sulfitobacter sp. KE42]MDF3459719.1 LacI family DNA-binding transcriptional regulator [Sulfitobacter sp. S74]MDF3463786.1 LacI family DNA-binding transcriptional regu
MAKVTSLDVATLAGVSRSAVSRVFTPGASVSPATASKVRTAARALGYRPNVLARSLITGRSRIIGLVVAYLENQFYPEAIEKLSKSLQEQGYHVLVFMASNDSAATQTVIDELLDYQVDGIVIASVGVSSDLTRRCEDAGIPIVLFNRDQFDDRLSSVTSDNMAGGARLGRFLVAGGHSRFGHIAGWEGASTQIDREAGFKGALMEAGAKIVARTVGNFHFDSAKEAAREMFDRDDPPDAVFVANDHMAFAVMDVLRFELGIRIPDDVSVVGYDDVPLASWASYDLTTVRQRANIMVENAIDLLMTRIDDIDTPPRRICIDGPLIIRGSARLPEGQDHAGI